MDAVAVFVGRRDGDIDESGVATLVLVVVERQRAGEASDACRPSDDVGRCEVVVGDDIADPDPGWARFRRCGACFRAQTGWLGAISALWVVFSRPSRVVGRDFGSEGRVFAPKPGVPAERWALLEYCSVSLLGEMGT